LAKIKLFMGENASLKRFHFEAHGTQSPGSVALSKSAIWTSILETLIFRGMLFSPEKP